MQTPAITLTTKGLTEKISMVKSLGNRYRAVCAHALNRTISGVKADVSKEVRERYNIKDADVKNSMRGRVEKAAVEGDHMIASVTVAGKRIALHKFGARPAEPYAGGRKKRPQVSVMVLKGGRKPVVTADPARKGFVARMKSGHLGIYQREGMKKLPISELTGPAVPQMVANEEVWNRISARARQRFEKNFENDINYELKKIGLIT